MELNRKLCAMRRKLSQRYWLDDSLGCCLLMWYLSFILYSAHLIVSLRLRLEDRLHLGKTQINLVLLSVCTIFETFVSKLLTFGRKK